MHRTRSGSGPRRRGVEAPRRSFQTEARGARPGSAPRRASVNPAGVDSPAAGQAAAATPYADTVTTATAGVHWHGHRPKAAHWR